MLKPLVHFVCKLLPILSVVMYLTNCGGNPPPTNGARLDFSAVTGLLNVLKATIKASPDYVSMTARLVTLNGPQHDLLIDSLVRVKASNSGLVAQIDSLLELPAYQLYYRQFRNVSPDVHRRVLLALPYEAIPSPASISSNLLDIANHLDALIGWADSLAPRIDIDSSMRIAINWLPRGEYETPLTYFICDGNGDAFAREGKICFDLYSLILLPRPTGSRYDDLDNIPLDDLHRIIAHEYHHIFAARFYAEYPTEAGDWKSTWYNRLLRRIVEEGTATHCNPPTGLALDIKEDTATVVAWIRSLNQELSAIRNDQTTEEAAQTWMNTTYHDSATSLLRVYLSRNLGGEELDREVAVHGKDRPSLVYTLGWWMVSRISHDGADPDAVRHLVVHPTSLAEKYNAILAPGADSLRFPVRM